MKKTRRDYVKIVLTIAIIAGLFMPYATDTSPSDYIFGFLWRWDRESLFALPIPLFVVIPLLILLIFKNSLKGSVVRVLNVIFLILYIAILLEYGYEIYINYGSFFDFSPAISIAVIVSLILLLLSLKYSITKLDALEHKLLATMALPIFLYFVLIFEDGIEDANYGFYIFNGSFIALYVMAVYTIFKNRNLKKVSKTSLNK